MQSSIFWMKENIDLSANGKLLLTGEYLVLVGAEALAFPVRFGQSIHVEPDHHHRIQWVSKENGITWFSCDLKSTTLEIISTSDQQIASRLVNLLLSAQMINPEFLNRNQGFNISVESNYPLRWGLGSSSTLIALVAGWAQVDKFKLYRLVSKGSGYDVACTDRNSMLFYQLYNGKVSVHDAQPGKAILNHTCFAYLGKKQETAEEVSAFLFEKKFSQGDVDRISELSSQICKSDNPSILCSLVEEHEKILGSILQKGRIAKRFHGFPGSVKSLGAWGGDFAMFVSEKGNEFIKTWLKQTGFNDVFTFNELKVTT
jgi:mevalonate kinase